MPPRRALRPFQPLSFATLAVCLSLAGDAIAQTYTADARTVGMGGGGSNANVALSMVPPAGPYAVIPIPLGLIQVLDNVRGFDPSNDKFDPAWAVESAANPLHYTFGRRKSGGDSPEARFMRDLVNGQLSRDLASYSSFHLPDSVDAEGLASPAFGGTIKFARRSSGALITVNPATTPFVVADLEADKGTGRAVDIGVQIVRNGWEGGFGVNGIANRIDWSELTLKRYTLTAC